MLSAPPAFALSQDQTLQFDFCTLLAMRDSRLAAAYIYRSGSRTISLAIQLSKTDRRMVPAGRVAHCSDKIGTVKYFLLSSPAMTCRPAPRSLRTGFVATDRPICLSRFGLSRDSSEDPENCQVAKRRSVRSGAQDTDRDGECQGSLFLVLGMACNALILLLV